MSERQEKKKRYNLRLMWIADFDKWLSERRGADLHAERSASVDGD